ncbi:MAG: RNA pseudouridine synthase [Pseudobdellovibrio sp.]
MAQIVGSQISSHGFEYGVKHFLNPKSGFISEIVCNLLAIDLEAALSLIKLGGVYVDNNRQIIDSIIEPNKLFRVHTKPRRHNTNYPWNDLIIYEDSSFLVLNKPGGIPSHAAVDNIIDNSLYQLELSGNRSLMITHRLDTLTEGLIVYGKTKYFVTSFNKLIQTRQIKKKYVALVETTTQLPFKLIHYMETSLRAPKKVTEFYQEKSALCELEIEKQVIGPDSSWVKINLMTGRTHQIRAQTSAMSAPIRGDQLYGSKMPWKENAIALRACEISFTWNDKTYEFVLPDNFT